MSLRRRLGVATCLSVGASAVNLAANSGRSWLTARLLGPADLGLLATAATLAVWACSLFGLGLANSISKYLAEHSGDPPKVAAAAGWALRVATISGLAGAVALVAAAPAARALTLASHTGNSSGSDARFQALAVALALSIPSTIVLNVSSGICLGLGEVGSAVVAGGLVLPLASLLLVAAAFTAASGVVGVAAAQSAACVAAAVVAAALAARAAEAQRWIEPGARPDGVAQVGAVLFAATVANSIWLYLHNVFLAKYWGAAAVGIFAIPFQLSYTLTLLIGGVTSYFFPAVAALKAAGGTAPTERSVGTGRTAREEATARAEGSPWMERTARAELVTRIERAVPTERNVRTDETTRRERTARPELTTRIDRALRTERNVHTEETARTEQTARAELVRLYRELSLWCAYGNLAPALVFCFGAKQILRIFGEPFATAEAVLALRVLAAAFLLYSLFGAMPSVVLAAGGWHRRAAAIELGMIFAGATLHAALTRRYGVAGAAAATGAALLGAGALRSFALRAQLGAWGFDASAGRLLPAALAAGASCAWVERQALDAPSLLVLPALLVAAAAAEATTLLALRDPIAWRAVAAVTQRTRKAVAAQPLQP